MWRCGQAKRSQATRTSSGQLTTTGAEASDLQGLVIDTRQAHPANLQQMGVTYYVFACPH